jgi:hypothetical protein
MNSRLKKLNNEYKDDFLDGERQDELDVSPLWEMYRNGLNYQAQLGIADGIPRNIRFYEGDQWPAVTPATKDMPRPVINVIKMIARNKKSGILSSQIKIVYTSDLAPEESEFFTEFGSFIERQIDIETIRNRMVKDGVIKGGSFVHFYWDAEADGESIEDYRGGLNAEVIDPLNIFFENPREQEVQNQKWILISKRVDVAAARAMCDNETDKSLIVPDEQESRYESREQEGNKLCTVLTRYFKRGGEVYHESGTRTVMLYKPRALTPGDGAAEKDRKEDAAENELPDKAEKKDGEPSAEYKAKLYPVVAYSYEERENSIYGMSEVEGLIPNQKAINFLLGMQLLSVQSQAWGKYLIKDGALKGQVITNEPGQVLIDYTPGGDGVKKLAEPSISSMPLNLISTFMENTRVVTGSTEVMTGEQLGKNQSGASIAQLQSQALKPIAELRDRFWRACEDSGRVLEMFFKLFYDKKAFTYTKNDQGVAGVFEGGRYRNLNLAINVEAGAGTQFSEAMTIAFLEKSLEIGAIDYATYVDMYPASALPFKSRLKKKLQEKEMNELAQAQAAIQQLQSQLGEAAKMIEQEAQTVEKTAGVIKENRSLQKLLAELQSEYSTKINTANALLTAQGYKNRELQTDAQALAVMAQKRGTA